MQVRHGFACVRAVVEDEAIATLVEAEFVGDFRGFEQQVAENLMVFRCGFGDAWDGFLWNDKHVRWRLRFDVAEREHEVVFIDNRGRNFAGGDFLEKGFAHTRQA